MDTRAGRRCDCRTRSALTGPCCWETAGRPSSRRCTSTCEAALRCPPSCGTTRVRARWTYPTPTSGKSTSRSLTYKCSATACDSTSTCWGAPCSRSISHTHRGPSSTRPRPSCSYCWTYGRELTVWPLRWPLGSPSWTCSPVCWNIGSSSTTARWFVSIMPWTCTTQKSWNNQTTWLPNFAENTIRKKKTLYSGQKKEIMLFILFSVWFGTFWFAFWCIINNFVCVIVKRKLKIQRGIILVH